MGKEVQGSTGRQIGMKSFLIFISGMFVGALLLAFYIFFSYVNNPSYHDCMMDWGNMPDHNCEDVRGNKYPRELSSDT